MNAAPDASAELIAKAWDDPRLANVLYHDWEATTYDPKWTVSYDDRYVAYAREQFERVAGTGGWPYERSLEVGCGTGFFTLNLKHAGVLRAATVTDISPGMVEVALRNARGLGFEVAGQVDITLQQMHLSSFLQCLFLRYLKRYNIENLNH